MTTFPVGVVVNCRKEGNKMTVSPMIDIHEDLLIAVLPDGSYGYISMSHSDDALGGYIRQTASMGATAWYRRPDTADFCEDV